MQKFRGLYQGMFVVQTFGTHFTAINGARKIGLDKSSQPTAQPIGGLALSCAAVCHYIILSVLFSNTTLND
jgi:hypothetical protein